MPIETPHLPFFNFRDLNEIFSGSCKDVVAMHEPTLEFKPLHNLLFFNSTIDIKKVSDEIFIFKNAHGLH
jgi:hypothetical protein